ncbi:MULTISPECIES: hypothetical protein [unclassified Bradyrhizobium]|uniref:hypothetical protein n=1 Tax=unclassified Bradyrhizobium TaxID=2631580 RepID=UPI0020B1F389|nr:MULTISPECIES: hypothetical protein [unclassified Bradyrhizobium]MCP3468227.1 hypothetical protein [Bradyrhizobium sp. CCGUVB23]MCP3477686.1 hypothetical protein [Bradyrhizobium sp. CCGUVB1N3]
MGRHPIGDSAISGAERIALWRKRHAEPAAAKPASSDAQAEIARLRAEIARLTVENAALKAAAHGASRPKPAAPAAASRDDVAARMRADFEAEKRERAKWGGRPRVRIENDIKQLLTGRSLTNEVRDKIVDAMLPHVAQQANIERGISRRTFRMVLGDLHGPKGPTGLTRDAFEAFKKLDVPKDGKRKWMSIVIADDKVQTMADVERKRQERSDRARAAAAKRKAK